MCMVNDAAVGCVDSTVRDTKERSRSRYIQVTGVLARTEEMINGADKMQTDPHKRVSTNIWAPGVNEIL